MFTAGGPAVAGGCAVTLATGGCGAAVVGAVGVGVVVLTSGLGGLGVTPPFRSVSG